MPVSRILILTGAAGAFLLMLTSVTTSQEFVYAPESEWRGVSEGSAEAVAVAAWRSQGATIAQVPTASAAATSENDDGSASSAPVVSDGAVSSNGTIASSAAKTPSSASEDPSFTFEQRGLWWERFNPFSDDGHDDDRDDNDRGDKKGKKHRGDRDGDDD